MRVSQALSGVGGKEAKRRSGGVLMRETGQFMPASYKVVPHDPRGHGDIQGVLYAVLRKFNRKIA